MASALPPALKVVEQCRVSPSRDGLPPLGERSLPFTFFDLLWLGSHPVERLFFYQWPVETDQFLCSTFPHLKRSLSLTLYHYYPLAGKLRRIPGTDKVEIYCTDADSVLFTVAECDGDLLHLVGNHARCVSSFGPLVPEIPVAEAREDGSGVWELMALQATVFPGAGVCIGVSIRHTACDGSGFTSFVKSWASACRTSFQGVTTPAAMQLPLIDRTLVSDRGLYTIFWNAMSSLAGDEWSQMPEKDGPDVVRSTFLIRRAHLDNLRLQISERKPGPSPRSPVPFRHSSFVLTCAYLWVCLLKVREEKPLPQEEESNDAFFLFAVDCRGRLHPPLPSAYFGNCLGACFVDARRSELLGEGGVAVAAEAIAESISRLGDGRVLEGAEAWINKVTAWFSRRALSIAGSPRFGVYGVDFGWGRPVKVEVVGIERTGAIALAESREDEGGVEAGVALPAPEMTRFSSLFDAGLELSVVGARQ